MTIQEMKNKYIRLLKQYETVTIQQVLTDLSNIRPGRPKKVKERR